MLAISLKEREKWEWLDELTEYYGDLKQQTSNISGAYDEK